MKSTPAFVQITPHIFKLDVLLRVPFLTVPVGIWLVREEAGWTMIDAGPPGYEDLVRERVLEHRRCTPACSRLPTGISTTPAGH
jgi:hypothetical protein